MRLFFLPISTRRAIIYGERIAHESATESRITKRIADKTNQTWANWERAEKGWKRHLTVYGNKLLSRIPMEEWSLKSVPALSEKVRDAILASANGQRQGEKGQSESTSAAVARAKAKVDVLFPGSFIKEEAVLPRMYELSVERKPLHRQRFWWSIVAMPLTLPFVLIPIIPNIPFFYLVYRAWSHWRALRGANHLEFLHTHNLLLTRSSTMLDELYAAGLLHPSRDPARDSLPIPPDQVRNVAARVASRQQPYHAQLGSHSPSSSSSSQSSSKASQTSSSSAANIRSDTATTVAASTATATSNALPRQQNHQDQGQNITDEDVLLLRRWNGKLLAERLKLPDMEIEIERAVEQVQHAIDEAKELRRKEAEGHKQK